MATERNHCLDGLRGFAALAVVIHHFVAAFWPTAFFRGGEGLALVFSETPLAVLINGPFFVYVFFVLSGYVLAGTCIRPCALPYQIGARYIRLGLPAGASVVVAYFVVLLGLTFFTEVVAINGNTWLTSVFRGSSVPWWSAAADALGKYFLTGRSFLNFVLWTMQIEFFGSLVVYIVSSFMLGSGRRIATYLTLAVVMVVIDPVAFKYGFPVRLILFAPFMFGALIREAGLGETARMRWLYWLIFLVSVFLGGSPHSDAHGTVYQPLVAFVETFAPTPLYVIKMAGAIMMVYSVIRLRVKFFETRLAVWLGELSFASYLIHAIVVSSLASFMFVHFGPSTLFVQLLVYLAVTYLLATVFHRAVDEPAITWSRKLKRRAA